MKFDHSEADTIMISIYGEIRKDGKRTPVVLDSAVTDIYVAAAHATHQFPGDFLIKKEGSLICCRTLFPDYLVNCIIPFHFLTDCGANSAFYGKSKETIFEKSI